MKDEKGPGGLWVQPVNVLDIVQSKLNSCLYDLRHSFGIEGYVLMTSDELSLLHIIQEALGTILTIKETK